MLAKLKNILLDYSTPQHYYLNNYIKSFSKQCDNAPILLDIGCGHSPFSKHFSYDDLFLVDLEKRGKVDVFADIQCLAFKSNSVDTVLLTEVLEHVPDEKQALCEIRRTLKPGCRFIGSVPFLFGIHETEDFRRWTKEGIKKLLEECGFEIIDLRSRGGIFSTLLCIWRNMPREILGGDFQTVSAKIFYPLIVIHYLICMLLTPLAVVLDRFDKKKLSSMGYVFLCKKMI